KQEIEMNLKELIPRARISATYKVLLKAEGKTVKEMMMEESQDAEVVFMGLMQPEEGEEVAYAEQLAGLVEGFPTVILVRNSGWFVGELV
ncbi:MAG: hypothetical protein O2954_10645, partial [bacterium]|nr:hypothetical protein [bacterium]